MTELYNVISEYESVDLGIRVTHPLTGQPLPVFAAEYVIDDYGTKAVMGVAGHDKRDRAFAEQHQLPVLHVEEELAEGGDKILCNSAQVHIQFVDDIYYLCCSKQSTCLMDFQ